MVGNKAQKAVAAALTGILTLGTAAPALASVNLGNGWTRLDGTYKKTTSENFDGGTLEFITKGTVDGQDRYDTMLDMAIYNSKDGVWGGTWTIYGDDIPVTDVYGNLVYTNGVDDFWCVGEIDANLGAGISVTTTEYLDNQLRGEGQYVMYNNAVVFFAPGADTENDDPLSSVVFTAGSLETQDFRVKTEYSGDITVSNAPSQVVLVSGTSYADSLSASGLAGYFGCPIITTPGDKLGEEAEKAIRWYASENGGNLKVWVIGGEAAVSADVFKAVKGINTNAAGVPKTVKVVAKRIAGKDRQQTSLNVMKTIVKEKTIAATNWNGKYTLDPSRDFIFVANGSSWADALSSSSFSYATAAPTLLTDASGNFSKEQLDYLKLICEDGGFDINVIGGPAKSAYDQLRGLDSVTFDDKVGSTDGQTSATWIHGDDRYETGKLVVETLAAQGFHADSDVAVATGKNWPDALVGGAFVGARNGILVLVEDGRYEALEAALKVSSRGGILDGTNFILGGKSAVSEDLAEDLVRLYV